LHKIQTNTQQPAGYRVNRVVILLTSRRRCELHWLREQRAGVLKYQNKHRYRFL